MLEIGNDLFNRLFHAVKFGKGWISCDQFIGKNAAEPGILRGIDQFGLTNCGQHAFCRGGVNQGIFFTEFEVFLQRIFFLLVVVESFTITFENAHWGYLFQVRIRNGTQRIPSYDQAPPDEFNSGSLCGCAY